MLNRNNTAENMTLHPGHCLIPNLCSQSSETLYGYTEASNVSTVCVTCRFDASSYPASENYPGGCCSQTELPVMVGRQMVFARSQPSLYAAKRM